MTHLPDRTIERELLALRFTLLLIFVVYPVLVLQSQFLTALVNPFLGVGHFFLVLGLFFAVLAGFSFNYVFGYLALMGVVVSDMAFALPLVTFGPHVALALCYAEGTMSLKPYWDANSLTISGVRENASTRLHSALHRLERKLLTIFTSLVLLSALYGLLPALVPTPASLVGLGIYATIALIVFATIIYLGRRD